MMNKSRFVLLGATIGLLLSACGGSPAATISIDAAMVDAIKRYSEVMYTADTANFEKFMCASDAAFNKQQLGSTTLPAGLKATVDLSDVKWKVEKSNAAGDVIQVRIESGAPKVKFGDTAAPSGIIPGSANGVRLKNEGGWKVCYTAPAP